VLCVTAGVAFWTTFQKVTSDFPLWYPLVRFSLALLGMGSSIVFYIRWQDRWSEAHAAEEFRLKRLALDMDRASWLVEVMLEWRKEREGEEIPKELIGPLAAGLFEPGTSSPALRHPAEDILAALLLSPASVDVDLPRGKVTLDRKGLSQMAKKVD
jgi:hypothetical protein